MVARLRKKLQNNMDKLEKLLITSLFLGAISIGSGIINKDNLTKYVGSAVMGFSVGALSRGYDNRRNY